MRNRSAIYKLILTATNKYYSNLYLFNSTAHPGKPWTNYFIANLHHPYPSLPHPVHSTRWWLRFFIYR